MGDRHENKETEDTVRASAVDGNTGCSRDKKRVVSQAVLPRGSVLQLIGKCGQKGRGREEHLRWGKGTCKSLEVSNSLAHLESKAQRVGSL